ncbi:hypothetical protein TNCT6_74990 [Streptomyces sp. 6-11-2]|nr:hypothetical protein TNCT6_74990 [Streptomyces sp. 6-11-2]
MAIPAQPNVVGSPARYAGCTQASLPYFVSVQPGGISNVNRAKVTRGQAARVRGAAVCSTIACFGGGVDVVRAGVGRDDAGAGEAAGELADACGDRGLPVDGSAPATVGFADTAASLAGPHALAATVTVRLAAASSRGLRRFFIEDLFMARRSVPSVCRPASHTCVTKVPPPLWLRREVADPRVRIARKVGFGVT